MEQGKIIQRNGGEGGKFAAPFYTNPFSSALPYDKLSNMFGHNTYIVNQPIEVISGQVVPWFG